MKDFTLFYLLTRASAVGIFTVLYMACCVTCPLVHSNTNNRSESALLRFVCVEAIGLERLYCRVWCVLIIVISSLASTTGQFFANRTQGKNNY